GGMSTDSLKPDSVIAYSALDAKGGCSVLFADGSVQSMTARGFAELSQRGLVQLAAPQELAEHQREVVAQSQLGDNRPGSASAPGDHLTISGSAGAMGGGGGAGGTRFFGGLPPASVTVNGSSAVATGAPALAPSTTPTASGIRSIRIELPQTGTPFLFTKVLNVNREPLSIRAKMIPLHTFQTFQMLWQSAAFLLGLVVWWTQWHRANRSTFILTLALALIVGSVCSLLIQWRALHDALIVGFPVAVVAVIALLVWKYWPRGTKPETSEEPPVLHPTAPANPIAPLTAGIALLLAIHGNSATAATNSEIVNRQSPIANASVSAIDYRLSAIGKASIVSASYTGTVNDRVALLDATLQFSGVNAGDSVPLFGDDVAVQSFTVKCGRAELIRNGGNLSVRFDRQGAAMVQIKMLVKVAGDVTKRRLAFAVPAALSSSTEFTLAEAGADVDFPAAISFKRILDKDQTRVEAVLGSSDRIELLWTPRVKRAEEVAATVFCRNAALVTFGGGVMNVRATLDYQITQGELRQARVQLPAGQKLLRVEGRDIRTWEIKSLPVIRPADTFSPAGGEGRDEGAGQVLVVDLMKGVPLGWQLTIETEKILEPAPAGAMVELPHALDVKRENGLVALRGSDELGLSIESSSGLERVDAEEFARVSAVKADKLASVFRFADARFSLRVRAEAFQPEIETVVKNTFRVGTEQILLTAKVDYTIKRAGVFALKMILPDGYRVEHVNGNNILQYVERVDAGTPGTVPARNGDDAKLAGSETGAPRRILEVTLKDRVLGAYSLNVELARSFKTLPATIAVAGVYPLGAAKMTGFVAVSAEPGVAVKTESFDGLTEIPAVSLPDYANAGASVLAYKFISAEPKSAAEWKLNVVTENVAAWVRAEIVNGFTLTETLVSGRAQVRFEIANAPVKELRVRVPAAFKNVEITGANIRSRERVDGSKLMVDSSNPSTLNAQLSTNYNVWRVELQSPTRGFYPLTVTWDEPRSTKAGALELAGISADGVERESGLLAISAKSPLQVSESVATDLQRVDTGDFPDWAGAPDSTTTLAYRYVRPGYQLALDVRRFDAAAVLEALVDSARFTSVVADDGQMMTEMSLSVRSNGKQFLEIELPADAKVWSAFVAGQPVLPSVRDGKLLLPIESSGDGDRALAVELTYIGTNGFPRGKGLVGFVSPKFDVPLKNARWEMYLPPDYNYQNFQGTMTRTIAASPETASSSFSILDYSRMEQTGKETARVDLQRDVSEARRQLAGGNVRVATENFNRAKAKFPADKDAADEFKKLEGDLKSAQASNLINAQNDFATRNSGSVAGEAPARNADLGLLYDNESAQKQWTKLQEAQEIVTARVQPLRVNLPVRGQHFAFTQVLQTEGGRPMTIQLFAASTKAVSWPMRGLMAAGAFLVLWGLVAILSRLTLRASRA
ncbi:MAG TPA: hypothetical protein VNN22_08750, partial [Verrucomicrobiae bacterium]|nr:hypothetical protein [Verrucomicrobiae bacterium]